jgi:hypothetical protein
MWGRVDAEIWAAFAAAAAAVCVGAEPGALEWNYVKFLVNREGQAIARYKPAFTDFEADVSTLTVFMLSQLDSFWIPEKHQAFHWKSHRLYDTVQATGLATGCGQLHAFGADTVIAPMCSQRLYS